MPQTDILNAYFDEIAETYNSIIEGFEDAKNIVLKGRLHEDALLAEVLV